MAGRPGPSRSGQTRMNEAVGGAVRTPDGARVRRQRRASPDEQAPESQSLGSRRPGISRPPPRAATPAHSAAPTPSATPEHAPPADRPAPASSTRRHSTHRYRRVHIDIARQSARVSHDRPFSKDSPASSCSRARGGARCKPIAPALALVPHTGRDAPTPPWCVRHQHLDHSKAITEARRRDYNSQRPYRALRIM